MNLEKIYCPAARGQVGRGNVGVHSQQETRCYCQVCDKTFSVTKGSIFYRLKTDPQTVILVLTLLAYDCPLQAIVVALGSMSGRSRAGGNEPERIAKQAVHQRVVGQSQLDLKQVQADEIKVKIQGGNLWMALAMMVPSRLWLGGVISPKRELSLIQALVDQVRAIALCRPLLVAVGGRWLG